MIVNARMYSVCPAARQAWNELLTWVMKRAEVNWQFMDWDAPKLLAELWARDDLGCAMMCGLPYSLREPKAVVLAAPVVSLPRYQDRSIYCSDIAVRSDSKYRSLEDTFGAVCGYTLKDSQSGYFAWRHHLLPFERTGKPLYREIVGGLMNPKGVIEALAAGRIDVGPLDSYCHDLFRHLLPELAAKVRVIATTDPTPMPPLVSTAPLDAATIERVRAAFLAVENESSLAPLRSQLLLERFVVPDGSVFDLQKARASEVEREGIAWP